MAKRKLTDGSEHAAHVLFDTLVKCEVRNGLVHVVGRSKDYERSGVMTVEYTRILYAALGKCLAEINTGPPIDGIELAAEGENIRFTLIQNGEPVASGLVTLDVGKKAHKFLTCYLDGPNVVRMKRKSAH